MADLSKSQQKRAEARQRRRKEAEPEPAGSGSEDVVEAATDGRHSNDAVKQAAKVVAGVAAAGAAAAAARAFTSHGDEQPQQQDEQPEAETEPEPQEQPGPEAQEQPAEEPEPEHEREHEVEPEPEEEQEPVAGADSGDARRVLDRARDQLEDLLGRPVESVSSLERTHDGWVLALEVVEVRRVPETMDVLASYVMELDGEMNLRRYHQGRRYHRARAGEGEDL